MGQLPKLVSYSSKLVLQILPSVSATVIGGYLLAQIHVGHNSDPPAPQIVVTAPPAAQDANAAAHDAAHDVPTVREDRAAMRKLLKERRENPQTPAVVRPIATAQPAPAASQAASTPSASMDSIAPNEPVEHAAAPSRTKPAVATAAPPRRETEATEAAADYVPAPPPGLPAAPAVAVNAPTPIIPPPAATVPMAPARAVPPPTPLMPPAMASAAPPPLAPPPPPPTGPVGSVFSALSNIVGHAANATGSTVNWVIDLPGKAISAGGRVIGVSSPPPPEPARFSDGQG